MLLKRLILLGLVTGLLVLNGSSAYSQSFPTRTIRIVASEVGGGADTLARLITPALSESLGQAVIVDNRGGILMPQVAASAAPDGYTLLLANSGTWLAEYLRTDLPYKNADFAPVSWVSSSPGILVVHPSVSANSVKELIALAKAKPGQLNAASGTPGTLNHIGPELFKLMSGIDIVNIPYKGSGPALNALVAGQVQLMFSTAGGVVPLIQAGRLRPLAVTSERRSGLFPDLPTMIESGLSGYDVVAVDGILVPVKTPATIIKLLSQEIAKAIERPEIRERMRNRGLEPVGSSPAEFAARIKLSMEQMGRVIKASGIRVE